MPAAYKTDRGRVRTVNEDSLIADEEHGIFVLADGLGGHRAGEVASSLAVHEAHVYLKDRIQAGAAPDSLPGLLTEAVLRAHLTVRRKSEADPRFRGMGTTLIITVIRDDEGHIAHVGDSRAYLLSGQIRRVTRDHTVDGFPYALAAHGPAPRSHMLFQALGTSESVIPELHRLKLREGDIVLLCSDGLTDMLSDEEIGNIVRLHADDPEGAADALVGEANANGGLDNISVILIAK